MNPLLALNERGQFVWLDHISRRLITGGGLQRLIDNDGLGGVTSNPTIFDKAIAGSADYDATLHRALDADPSLSNRALAERLIVEDIQLAADVLRPVYDDSDGENGFVSLEVSPGSAHDTGATIAEARHLWRLVSRPNVMIKVPATVEGIRAVEVLTADGINVNITLMFSLEHYEAVAQAYLRGIDRHPNPRSVVSVASVFVSRLDLIADRQLEAIGSPEALALRGRTAIANAKRVYRRFREIFDGADFAALKRRGARLQRPLWASTGTKNPSYSDVLYLEALIGPDTITTVPPSTMDAFRDHGHVRVTLGTEEEVAEAALESAAALGLDVHAMTERLQADALKAFASSFDQLLATLAEKRRRNLTVAS
ncbi:MAG TPA: transaldolase [Vicinamibacterales bacterium]|nr:transaldolase [Vicinamibacterales bacterium]